MAEQKNAPAPLPTGGSVAAIVPQTFEEIQRISNTIIAAGVAPASLVKRDATAQQNIAAVATAIMAGAELGLPPLVALRSFTVINGRPALYADGNIAVIRKAKGSDGQPICSYIRHGYTQGADDLTTFAWCEACRADNGETHREEFTIADAKRAGLWDEKPTRRAKVWKNNQQVWTDDAPNDSPWHRYPSRMMMWRATGYCVRWLFADVLGGMPDEYEAREIEQMIDVTPRQETKPEPPDLPETPEEPAKVIEGTASAVTSEPDSAESEAVQDRQSVLTALDEELSVADSADIVDEIFDAFDVQAKLAGDDAGLAQAFEIKTKHINRIPRPATDAGQVDMFEAPE